MNQLRWIKLFLLSLFFIFLLATAMSLLVPSHIRISKAVNLHASRDSVWVLIKSTDRWKEWHPAFMNESTPPVFPEIKIKTIRSGQDEVVMELQQGNKESVPNGWRMYQSTPADSLTLQWYMDFHLKWYPWKKLSSLFFENTYGMMMEQGLANIKKITHD